MDLTSGFINVDWDNNLLRAFPTNPADTIAKFQKPTILERGRDPMVGDSLIYNLKSRKGRIKQGRSKADDGYYAGNEIRNNDQKIYYIENSSYTTCDLETPHFHFESTNMKIINQDKVIARPIVLYISRIPIFGLPFGIFPHKSGGRHSGWIMPGYGENSLRGQYINNLGYFWAPSDFWGTKFTMSFGDRQGFVFNLDNDCGNYYGSKNCGIWRPDSVSKKEIITDVNGAWQWGLDTLDNYEPIDSGIVFISVPYFDENNIDKDRAAFPDSLLIDKTNTISLLVFHFESKPLQDRY